MEYCNTWIFRGILSGAIFIQCHLQCIAQLFPGLEGEVLVSAIQDEYTPTQLLNETMVKDTLYARIFLEQDSVRCIYSGLSRFLPTGVDPSQFLFGSGLETESLNLEHGWPQAKGATEGTPAYVDMHHLFPARTQINTDRANHPFRDIDDITTEKWYWKETELDQIPATHIEAYAEYKPGSFEPRESVKGDIARAMFYFWTIYQQEAISADPDFFDQQKNSLCEWHIQDPVDDFEAQRNDRISLYQGGTKNPFILDCTLPERTYCSEFAACEIVQVEEIIEKEYSITYDPEEGRILIKGEQELVWNVWIMDIVGKVIHEEIIATNQVSDVIDFPAGVFFAVASSGKESFVQKFYKQ